MGKAMNSIPYDSVTVVTSCKILERVQKMVSRDALRDYYDVIHEIHAGYAGCKLGYYRVIIGYTHRDGKRTSTSHIFDLQLYLDMKDEWEAAVDKKTQQLMQEVAPRVVTQTKQ